jgi:hypothetical protein
MILCRLLIDKSDSNPGLRGFQDWLKFTKTFSDKNPEISQANVVFTEIRLILIQKYQNPIKMTQLMYRIM